MSYQTETASFIDDLERVAKVRSQVASSLSQIAKTLESSEIEADKESGRLGLDREVEDLSIASDNLAKGVFRLMVLGDMKRGKSTLLNALLGENLLPSDVNPCTALLTVLRYGPEKKVTVYFNDGKSPEQIDFKSFKRRYTIDPGEAKRLEEEKKEAFPDIDYAVVEYPLALLEKGVEIVDSPGLNDTEARNELSLGYINNCHAILFVLKATQPCTLAERRYLENYLRNRGLTVFFLINAWDQVRESLIDPDDEEELDEAEYKLRRVFKANLAEYCQVEGYDIYNERVFEISALKALRQRVKNPNASLKGTGFPEFIGSLNTFLTKERAIAEFRQVRTLARQAESRVRESIDRRIPLLDENVNQLKERISSVQPEFDKLNEIRDRFQEEIRTMRDKKAKAIADSFHTYVLNAGNTFETDFLRYQPSLGFLDFLSAGKREAFENALTQAFEQYIYDKLSAWSVGAEQEMNAAFAQLSQSAIQYGADYAKVTDKIAEKLTGQKVQPISTGSQEDNSPAWAKWAMGLFSLARGNIAGVAMAGAGFDWKNILLNLITVIGVGSIITAVTGIVLGPVGLALLGLGVGVLQADQARKELVKATKKELMKYLPKVADEQRQNIYDAIKECFDSYEKEVSDRINDDIDSRKAELSNLLAQKEEGEINRDAELERLKKLDMNVSEASTVIEKVYQDFIASVA